MRCFGDVFENAKHRANDASNDVNRPPLPPYHLPSPPSLSLADIALILLTSITASIAKIPMISDFDALKLQIWTLMCLALAALSLLLEVVESIITHHTWAPFLYPIISKCAHFNFLPTHTLCNRPFLAHPNIIMRVYWIKNILSEWNGSTKKRSHEFHLKW